MYIYTLSQSGLREAGVVYPTVETTVQLDPGNIACSNYSSNTCTVCISSARFYSISITQTNVIGTSENEATFDCKLKVIESLGSVSVNHWMFVSQFCKLKVDEVVYVGVTISYKCTTTLPSSNSEATSCG